MPQFSYKARRRTGEAVEGVLEVPDRSAALLQIERLGLFPVAVEAAKGGATAAPERTAARKGEWADRLPPALREILQRKRKPKLQELATFTQQLANLLKSGMPLTVALNSMMHLESKGISADVTKQLKQEVMEGRSLSDAMAQQPAIFSEMYINMVRAGEQSGALVDVLRRLADHFQQFAEVQAKFTAAMIYPALVCCVGVLIIGFFMFFMMPKFMEMFTGFNLTLPLPTRMLMAFTYYFTRYWWVLFAVALVLVMLFKRFQATEEGKRRIDGWKMNAPVFGKVMKLNLFGQFARTLSTLLHNGVPVLTALKITEQIIPNLIIKDAIARTREGVTDGKTIAQPLAHSKIFPQLMIDLLKIGEDTGDVPGALENVADTYENELSIQLRVMTTLIEPVLIIIMALVVGFLLLSVLLPLFKLISGISGGPQR